jgi:hypothetical protein
VVSSEEVARIADGWVEEFSVDPYVLREREMTFWFKLDDLVHHQPPDALQVFERIAEKDIINWTFEGLAVGPLRTFLMIYGDRFHDELAAIRQRNSAFDEMHALAVEGL